MKIIPAILTDNLENFKKQIKIVEEFTNTVQIDIMDGEFVNNTSFDLNLKNTDLNKYLNTDLNTDTKLELHLMVNHPLDYIKKWQGVKNVFRMIFHIESLDNPNKVIKKIKSLDLEVGIAINPDTPVEKLKPYLDKIDLILFMTVYPGKQGGGFLPEVGEKIKQLQIKKMENRKFLIAIDGGANKKTIKEIKSWGVDIIGVGSAIIKQKNPEESYKNLLKQI